MINRKLGLKILSLRKTYRLSKPGIMMSFMLLTMVLVAGLGNSSIAEEAVANTCNHIKSDGGDGGKGGDPIMIGIFGDIIGAGGDGGKGGDANMNAECTTTESGVNKPPFKDHGTPIKLPW
jgi:hypothetical protein